MAANHTQLVWLFDDAIFFASFNNCLEGQSITCPRKWVVGYRLVSCVHVRPGLGIVGSYCLYAYVIMSVSEWYFEHNYRFLYNGCNVTTVTATIIWLQGKLVTWLPAHTKLWVPLPLISWASSDF